MSDPSKKDTQKSVLHKTSSISPVSSSKSETRKSLKALSTFDSGPMIPCTAQLRLHMRRRINNEHSRQWTAFQTNKILKIDDILSRQIPELMRQLIEVHMKKLTPELRNRNIMRAQEILDLKFIIPKTDKDIEVLRNWYLSLCPSTSVGKEYPLEFDYNGVYFTTGMIPMNTVLFGTLNDLVSITQRFVKVLRNLMFAFMLLRPEKSHSDNVGVEIQHDVESELNTLIQMFEKDSINYSPYKLEEERCKFYKSIWQTPQSIALRRDFIEFEGSNFDLMKFEVYESWAEMNSKLEFIRINLDKVKNPRHDARSHSRIVV